MIKFSTALNFSIVMSDGDAPILSNNDLTACNLSASLQGTWVNSSLNCSGVEKDVLPCGCAVKQFGRVKTINCDSKTAVIFIFCFKIAGFMAIVRLLSICLEILHHRM